MDRSIYYMYSNEMHSEGISYEINQKSANIYKKGTNVSKYSVKDILASSDVSESIAGLMYKNKIYDRQLAAKLSILENYEVESDVLDFIASYPGSIDITDFAAMAKHGVKSIEEYRFHKETFNYSDEIKMVTRELVVEIPKRGSSISELELFIGKYPEHKEVITTSHIKNGLDGRVSFNDLASAITQKRHKIPDVLINQAQKVGVSNENVFAAIQLKGDHEEVMTILIEMEEKGVSDSKFIDIVIGELKIDDIESKYIYLDDWGFDVDSEFVSNSHDEFNDSRLIDATAAIPDRNDQLAPVITAQPAFYSVNTSLSFSIASS
ncbi:hypothetical protein [Yersinia mollaretii]|uniref:hypothetical protein n=1 Tax=Yersinia mollaretii TaxID=33060 RepID=UPI0011A205C9|nr:hypothetical protein [Yersinia mollaretii]